MGVREVRKYSLLGMLLPWRVGLVDLLPHMNELKAGGDVRWQPPVDAHSLPAMVWLISSSEQPDDFAPIPPGWDKTQYLIIDDTQVRLYLTCHANHCGHDSKGSSRHASAHP